MKTFLIISLLTIIFNGCTTHNAFDKFNITPTRELSEDSIQSFKLKHNNKVDGIVSVVYLNKVLPKLYKNNEYFYVYFYVKDKNTSVTFTLNGQPSMLREKLKANNEFSYLTSFDAFWSKYYLIGFKEQGNVLDLNVSTSKAAEATLKFVKDE
jgi:hypothetical protein